MKIETLSESKDRDAFLGRFGRLPKTLYPERPLPPESYCAYLLEQFPEIETQFFIASQNGVDAGRIGCNLSKGHPGVGFFGFFEVDLAAGVADELISSAQDWLVQRGINTIIGPIDFNVWLGNRFKLSRNDYLFSWEPNGPSEYPELFVKNGFEMNQEYISMFYDDSEISFERTKSAYEGALKEGFSFRNLDLKLPGELEKLYQLNLKAFAVNYMYEPITFEQYKNIHIKGVESADMQYSYFIQNPAGKEIGYVFSFIEKHYHILKSVLIDPRFQGARLASSLIHASQKQARKNGFKKCVGAMVRKGNVSERFFDHLQKPVEKSEYAMLKKAL